MKAFRNKKDRKKFDKVTYIAAVVGPFLTIPQIVEIYTTHIVAGINLMTRSFWIGTSAVRAVHAYQHKDKALVFNAVVFFITEVIVVAGIVMYS